MAGELQGRVRVQRSIDQRNLVRIADRVEAWSQATQTWERGRELALVAGHGPYFLVKVGYQQKQLS